MAAYLKIDPKKLPKVLSLYLNDVEGLEHEALKTGITNTNYKIRCSGKDYVLKVAMDKTPKQLKEELEVLFKLDKQKIPVIPPLKTKKGEIFFEDENITGALFPYVKGDVVAPSPKALKEIGKITKSLHQLPEVSKRPFSEVGHDPLKLMESLESSQIPLDFKKSFEAYLNSIDDQDWQDDLGFCFMHGDLYIDNILFSGDKIEALLDFEQSGFGPKFLDIGITLSGSSYLEKFEDELILSFINGYELENEYKIQVPHMMIWGLYSIALWRIERFNIKKIVSGKEDSYKELIQKAEQLRDELPKIQQYISRHMS